MMDSTMKKQYGDNPAPYMSVMSNGNEHPDQIACFMSKTSEKTRDIVVCFLLAFESKPKHYS